MVTEGTASDSAATAGARPARLLLPGHDPTPAQAELIYRTKKSRTVKALVSLLGFWILTPIVALIPPHIPWALLAFLAGIYFAWSNLRGSYHVQQLEGDCPRCGNHLAVKPGSRISLPHKMTCFVCHHEPVFEVERGAEEV